MSDSSTKSRKRSKSHVAAAEIEAVPLVSDRVDASTPETESFAATIEPEAPAPMAVTRSALAQAQATTIDVHQGAVGAARADAVTMDQGAVGLALANDVDIRQSVTRTVLARSVRVEQSFIRTLVANEVRVERATGVGFLLARRVVGDVRVLLDWRGAVAFGAAAGFVMGLVRRGGGRAAGRARGRRRD